MKNKIKKLCFPIIGTIVSFLIVLLTSCTNLNSTYIKVDYHETGIQIETKRSSIDVNFKDIEEVNLIEAKYGNTQLDGIKWTNCEVGIFKNDLFDRYCSFLHEKASKMIVITFLNNNYGYKILVIGLESESDNTALFDYLKSNISLIHN